VLIADLPRCHTARLEQEPRKRPQRGPVLRRCHAPNSHVVENEVELDWGRPGPLMRARNKLSPSRELYQRSRRAPPA